MPEYDVLKMQNIIIHIFDTAWFGHSGIKFYKGKFERFLDHDEIEVYKILQKVQVYQQ